jgi:hypothetical protein
VFGGVFGGVFGVVLSNTPPRSNPDKHWPRSKFGGVLGEKRKIKDKQRHSFYRVTLSNYKVLC